MKEQISRFFNDYVSRFNAALQGHEPDVEGTVGSFAGCFVEASPAGIQCSRNDERFREAVPKGFAYYRETGMMSIRIGSRIITQLDAYHAMVKIHWQSVYCRKDGGREEVGFDVHYFVQVLQDQPRIFAYITGDEQKALEERGLLPGR